MTSTIDRNLRAASASPPPLTQQAHHQPVIKETPEIGKNGYIGRMTFGGQDYEVRAFILAADGSKTPLPDDYPEEALKKITILIHDLLTVHSTKTPGEMAEMSSKGLKLADASSTSHNFRISTVDPTLAERVATHRDVFIVHPTQPKEFTQASGLRTQEVWCTLEEIILGISPSVRKKAHALCEKKDRKKKLTDEEIREKIRQFMNKDFNLKEDLLSIIHQQAEITKVRIKDKKKCDYANHIDLFVKSLNLWLENNGSLH